MKRATLTITSVLAALAGSVHGQCEPTWNAPPSITYPEGVNGSVMCSTTWDPDGAGPKSPCLVIGGSFSATVASGFNNIAMWDGSGWKPLHIGVNGAVRALTVDTSSNTLIAGGSFSSAGLVNASKVARFNGASGLWSALGSGITSGGDVNALTFDTIRNVLYIGGSFTTAGGLPTGGLATFNGVTYGAVGAFFSGVVNALYYWATGDGAVYVGGSFVDPTLGNAANLIRFHPSTNTWFAMSGGLPGGGVNAITSYAQDGLNHRIIAAGSFGFINGQQFNSIARYDGIWTPMSTGLVGTVRGLATQGNDLYAVGQFTLNGNGQIMNRAAKWTGTSWQAMGSGLNGSALTAANYKDAIHIAGEFTQAGNTDGNTTATRIATFDGSRWAPLKAAPSGPVRCMLNNGSSLLIGGSFDMFVGGPEYTFAHNLVSFNGTQFSAGVGVQGFNGTNGPINALLIKSNGITLPTYYVAGQFTQAGAVNASNIASYQFSGEFSQVGQGVNGEVFALANFGSSGPLGSTGTVATGNFSASGGTPVANIVRFGPGAVSLNLGSGLNGPGRCLMNYQGKLLVGGHFTTAGGALTGHLAQWDGNVWSTFNGAVVTGTIYAMTLFNGNPVIAGDFVSINGSPAHKVAMWNGSTFVDMGTGIDTSVGSVTALAVHNGELHAGGYFATINGQPQSLARWNGFSWVPVGGEVSGGGIGGAAVSVLTSFNNTLYAGGPFTRAQGSYSPHLSQYACTCYANCDNSTNSPILNANDFICFINNYVLNTPYANCDGSVGQPALTGNDFICYINRYAAGCS